MPWSTEQYLSSGLPLYRAQTTWRVGFRPCATPRLFQAVDRNGLPPVFWLLVLYTVVHYRHTNHARRARIPIDEIDYDFQIPRRVAGGGGGVTPPEGCRYLRRGIDPSPITAGPKEGCWHRWVVSSGCQVGSASEEQNGGSMLWVPGETPDPGGGTGPSWRYSEGAVCQHAGNLVLPSGDLTLQCPWRSLVGPLMYTYVGLQDVGASWYSLDDGALDELCY